MRDIPRLLPVVEVIYAAVEDDSTRAHLAKVMSSAISAEWVVWRVGRSAGLSPSPEPSPHRLVARMPAWEGGEVELVVCRAEHSLPFGDAERRLFGAMLGHLARAARLGSWGPDGTVCIASTAIDT